MNPIAPNIQPNCAICKWFSLDRHGGHVCSAQARKDAKNVYANEACIKLYEVKEIK